MNTVDPKFPNAIVAAVVVDETNLPSYMPDRVVTLVADRNGGLLVRVNGSISASIGTSVSIADAMAFTSGSLVGSAMVGYNGASFDRVRSGGDSADGVATASLGILLANVRNALFNGTTWDRARGNTELTLLASAARTATTNSADTTNYNAKGGHIIINVTGAGTSTLTVTVQGKDPVSGTYYDVLPGTAITTAGITVLKVFPGATAVSGGAVSDILPRTFRVNCVKGDGSSWSFSVSASLVV